MCVCEGEGGEDEEEREGRLKEGQKEGEQPAAYLPAAELLAVYTGVTGVIIRQTV